MAYEIDWEQLYKAAKQDSKIAVSIRELETAGAAWDDAALISEIRKSEDDARDIVKDMLVDFDRLEWAIVEAPKMNRTKYFSILRKDFKFLSSYLLQFLFLLIMFATILAMGIQLYVIYAILVAFAILLGQAAFSSYSIVKNYIQEELYKLSIELNDLTGKMNIRIIDLNIIPFLNSHINHEKSRLNENRSTLLTIKTAPGLWENLEFRHEIGTSLEVKIRWLLNNLKSGSIGIAGPRGIGKTTLLNSLCRSIPEEKKKIYIYIPAPVRYDSRELILSLFIKIIEKILTEDQFNSNNDKDVPKSYLIEKFQELIRNFLPILFFSMMIGFVLIGVSIGYMSLLNWRDLETLPATLLNLHDFAVDFHYYISINPSDLFRLGLNLVAIPSILLLPQLILKIRDNLASLNTDNNFLSQMREITINTIRNLLSDGYFGWANIFIKLFTKIFRNLIKKNRNPTPDVAETNIERKASRQHSSAIDPSSPIPDYLIKEALLYLKEFTYQLSFSYGSSQTLRLPESINFLESQSEQTESRTKHPKTLLQIIDDFRVFVTDLATFYPIVFCIDEVDKISSVLEAKKFLNDIKAIFNIPNCIFLVSISDNALSSFSRRGLALRDEFDTSFDFVFSLDIPGFNFTKELIWLRVIGMPLPFLYLSYILSGGIPRDTIRVCREMFYFANNFIDPLSVFMMGKELVLSELKAKANAVLITTTNQLTNSNDDMLFQAINKIQRITRNEKDLSNKLLELHDEVTEKHEEYSKLPADIRRLCIELKTYLYFYSTILEYFCKISQLKNFSLIIQQEFDYLESLAIVQRSISLNPEYAHVLVDEFRKHERKMSHEWMELHKDIV